MGRRCARSPRLPGQLHLHGNFRLPSVEPSATLCLRRLGARGTIRPDAMPVHATQVIRDLGLGDGLDRTSPVSVGLYNQPP